MVNSNPYADALDFSGRRILVVGGSSGIGNGVAQGFRACGADVHVWGTRSSAADYGPAEGSVLDGLEYRQVDVTDFAALEALEPGFDRLDVLVLSQGTLIPGGGEHAMAGFQRVLDVNLSSVMACALKFKELLAASGGVLVLIGSIGGYRSSPEHPAYTASKAALVRLTGSLALAWAKDGVRVVGIAPGPVPTKLVHGDDNPERRKATLARIPVGRMGAPDDIASAAIFLASPLSSFIVGQMLCVDGGVTL
ncbi:MAG: SDR family oxidoreductase [Microbacterium sp.]